MSSAMAATAQLRGSCSGIKLSCSLSPTKQFIQYISFQLPSDCCEWKVVNCQGPILSLGFLNCSSDNLFLSRALPCLTLPRESLLTLERSSVRKEMRLWLFVRPEQVFDNKLYNIHISVNDNLQYTLSFRKEKEKPNPLHRCSCSICIRIVTMTCVKYTVTV